MPLAAVRWKDRNGDWEAPVEDFLAAAESDPLFPIPFPVAKAMLDDEGRPTEGFSITELLSGCLRCKVLQRYEPYTEDIMERWHRWRGTAFHSSLEAHPVPGTVSEVRFYSRIGDDVVSGKPDIIYPNAIVDLKTTKRIPLYGPWPNHVEQLNAYRWLVNHAESAEDEQAMSARSRVFERLIVWYADEAGVKPMECKTSRKVATKPGAKNPYKTVKESAVWDDEEVEALLVPNYYELRDACNAYQDSRTLPAYPPDFDYVGGWEHTYSPTARLCVERYIEERLGR